MNGLLFLSSDDFQVRRGDKGNILCNGLQGFSLVLFYSTNCKHCNVLVPIFKKLPGNIAGCQFAMVNISTNRECIEMSKNTISPITYVPYIILFIDGRPFMKYDGPSDVGEIGRFVMEVSRSLATRSRKEVVKDNDKVKHSKGKIPEYTVGHPLYGKDEDRCYLEFNSAYGEGKQQ